MHYYDSDGLPAYEIMGKNGKMRTPYTKEAKVLGLVPGSTSISQQLGSDNLTNYYVNKAIYFCSKIPYCEMGMSFEAWVAIIKDKSKKDGERITSQGHAIHDALEKYYKTGKISTKYREYIIPVIELISDEWPQLQRIDWIAERSFNFRGVYGGKVDLSTGYDNGIILDFKTKDTDNIEKFVCYEGHKQQLISYAYGLKIPNAKCGNVFLSALKPNITKLIMHDDLHENWEKFKVLLQYWHLDKYKQDISHLL